MHQAQAHQDPVRALALKLLTPPRRKTESVPERFLSFPTSHSDVGVVTLGTAGPSVLTLHGWGGSPADFGLLHERLVGEGFQVFAASLPAHAPSTGSWTSPHHSAQAVRQLLDEIGPLRGVVGHSIGATVLARALASSGHHLQAVALVAGPDRYTDSIDWMAKRAALTEDQAVLLKDCLRTDWGVPIEDVVTSAAVRRISALQVAVFHGLEDAVVPHEDARRIAEANRTVSLELLDGVDHRSILDDERFIEKAVAMLQGAQRRS